VTTLDAGKLLHSPIGQHLSGGTPCSHSFLVRRAVMISLKVVVHSICKNGCGVLARPARAKSQLLAIVGLLMPYCVLPAEHSHLVLV
jgi:hypothetical protein